MTSLNILHVTPYFEQAWAYGGIPRVVSAQAHSLAELGHRVTIVTTDARDANHRLTEVRRSDGLDVRVFRNLSNHLAFHHQLFTPVGLGRYLRGHGAGFDVAHLHACHNLLGVAAARRLGRCNVPWVLQPNGTARPIERRVLAKRIFAALLGRRVLEGAARVIAVSNVEVGHFKSLGIDDSSTIRIANPVVLDEFDHLAELEPPAWALDHDRTVLYLGQITPRKRVDLLLEAFSDLNDPTAQLVVAGGTASTEKPLRALAKQLGIRERVVFAGVLEGDDRLRALTAATVLVYPTENEIFGLVPLEALLCGTPVVIAGGSGSAEVIEAVGGGAIVEAGDREGFAGAIGDVLGNPGAQATDVASAQAEIRQRYSAATIAGQLQSLYREVVVP